MLAQRNLYQVRVTGVAAGVSYEGYFLEPPTVEELVESIKLDVAITYNTERERWYEQLAEVVAHSSQLPKVLEGKTSHFCVDVAGVKIGDISIRQLRVEVRNT